MRVPTRPLLVAVVAVLAISALVVIVDRQSDSAIERAARLLEDDGSFATVEDAGATFTQVSVVLQDGGEACLDGDVQAGECDHLFVAAAYARVSAVSLLACTRRGMLEGRTRLRTFLAALDRDPRSPLPDTPSCGE